VAASVGVMVVLASFQVSSGQERRDRERGQRGESRENTTAPQATSEKKSDEKKPDEKKSESPKSGPQQPAKPLHEELEHTADGKIRFSFQNQPWLEVLQWLAKSSNLALDWQEVPGAPLNLTTQRSYTLDEARDLLNMHLAARGFTLLRHGEVMALAKLDKLNPALVPRIEPHELASRDPHEFVRVSYPLNWLVAESAVKEFAPVLSPYGKLTPMTATNRLEAMDSVANLLEVAKLLDREQSSHGEERLVVEFKLKYVRAEDILSKLKTLVGAPNTELLRPADRVRMQFMRGRERGNDGDGENRERNQNQRGPARQEAEVHLVINEQENSILANAPPDKLAVVRQAVEALDVPPSGAGRASDAVTRMKIYRTKNLDPDAMTELIQELVQMGKLGSSTQIQGDDNSNTLIVYATPVDHMAIANLVSQIDEEDRDVRIIRLRDLDPNYALSAVKLLLQGEQSGGGGEGRRWRRGGGGGGGGDDQFRIEADLERSRLLLWANDEEYEQVQSLLAKLGENSQGTNSVRGNVRVLNMPARGTQQALDTLERVWPSLRTNPLMIRNGEKLPVRESALEPGERSSIKSQRIPSDNRTTAVDPAVRPRSSEGDLIARALPPVRFAVAAVENDVEAAKSDTEPEESDPQARDQSDKPAAQKTPNPRNREAKATSEEEVPSITVTESADGQLIISSKDLDALDAAEKLLEQLLPKQGGYHVFRLKHASPFAIQMTIEQIFGINSLATDERSGLPANARAQLHFVSDLDTRTLLVQGATAEQLQTIQDLLDLYDQPESLDADLKRTTQIYEVKYSRAEAVAEVVKEVFRDLLSANDKAFVRDQRDGDRPSRDSGYGMNYSTKIPQFKGLLSIGVEDNSNTVVVSAPAYLIDDVMTLIRDVDERSSNHRVRVVQLNSAAVEPLRSFLSQMPGVTTSARGPGRSNGGSGSPSASPASPSPSQASGPARDFQSREDRGESFRRNRENQGQRNRRGGRD
jgi:type II secretory pathway component GspD/PulD (secretin)